MGRFPEWFVYAQGMRLGLYAEYAKDERNSLPEPSVMLVHQSACTVRTCSPRKTFSGPWWPPFPKKEGIWLDLHQIMIGKIKNPK